MVVAATVALLVCATASVADQAAPVKVKSNWFNCLFECTSWEKAVSTVDSPERAAKLVRQNVRFEQRYLGKWSDGETTWNRRTGDCKAFATTVIQLCKDAGLGANATILVFSANAFEGHAVAAGTWNGRLWISSNGWFSYVVSMDHASELVAEEMGWNARATRVIPLDKVGRTGNTMANPSK